MSGRKISFLVYLVAVTTGCLSGWLYYVFEKSHNSEYAITLEQAKSSASEFEAGVIRIIENRARLNRTLFKNNRFWNQTNEIQNEKTGFEKCFISSFMGLVCLIPVSDPFFQNRTTATETLYPNGEFVRVSPIFMTTENFENCISCHRHEKLKVGDIIGAVAIRILNVRK